MPVVGDAYIVVRAITDKVKKDIAKGFNGLDAVADKAGKQFQTSFIDGFNDGLSDSLSTSLNDALTGLDVDTSKITKAFADTFSDVEEESQRAGGNAADTFSSEFSDKLATQITDTLERTLKDVETLSASEGARTGAAFANTFGTVSDAEIRNSISETFRDVLLQSSTAGTDAAARFSRAFSNALDDSGLADDLESTLGETINTAITSVDVTTTGEEMGRDLNAAIMTGLGNKEQEIGDLFSRAGQTAADRFYESFNSAGRDRIGRVVEDAFNNVDTDPLRDKIRESLSDASGGASAGSTMGSAFTGALLSEIAKGFDGLDFGNILSFDPLDAAHDTAEQFTRAFETDARRNLENLDIDIGRSINFEISPAAYQSANDSAVAWALNLQNNVERQFDNWSPISEATSARLSQRLSSAFGGGKSYVGRLLADSEAASRAFTTLYGIGQLVGPAISTVLGAISSLIVGLGELAAAAGQAGPAVAGVFAGIAAAAVQGFATAKLAFGGVRAALKESLKSTQATQQSTGALNDNFYAQQKASQKAFQLSMSRAQQDFNSQTIAAEKQFLLNRSRAFEDYNRQLQQQVEDTAKNLFDPYKEAELEAVVATDLLLENLAEQTNLVRKQMAELELIKGLGLSQDAVDVLGLADPARAKQLFSLYQDVLTDPQLIQKLNASVSDRMKVAASLTMSPDNVSFRRSEQAFKQSMDRMTEDYTRSQDAALKAFRTQQSRAMEDFQIQMSNQMRNLARNVSASGGVTSAYDQLKKINPEAAKFVDTVRSVKDEWKALQVVAGQGLFPSLSASLLSLTDKTLPTLRDGLLETGYALGTAAEEITKVLTSQTFLERFAGVMQANAGIIETAGGVIANLVDIFNSVLLAVSPVVQRFADWVLKVTEGWQATLNTSSGLEKLTGFFKEAGDVAALLGDIFGNIFGGLWNIANAAAPAGRGLLMSFKDATAAFETWAATLRDDETAQTYFEGVADNVRAIGRLFNEIVKEFAKLADNPSIGETADALTPVVSVIGDILDTLTDAGPSLAGLLGSLATTFKLLTDSGAITAFIDTLKIAVDILNELLGNDIAQSFLLWIGPIFAVGRAFAFIEKIGAFALKVIIGSVLNLGDVLLGAGAAVGGFFKLFSKSGRADLGGSFKNLFKGLSGGKAGEDVGKTMNAGIMSGLGNKGDEIVTAVGSGATKSSGKVSGAFSKIGKTIGAAIMSPIKLIVAGIQGIFAAIGLSNPVGWIIIGVVAAIAALAALFKWLYNNSESFRKWVDNAWQAIKTAVDKIGEWFGQLWDTISSGWNSFQDSLSDVGGFFSDIWDSVIEKAQPFIDFFTGLWGQVGSAITSGIDVIKSVLEPFIDFFSGFWGIVAAAISGGVSILSTIFGPALDIFVGFWETAGSVTSTGISFVVDLFKTLGDFVMGILRTWFGAMRTLWSTIFAIVYTPIKIVVGLAILAFQYLRDNIGNIISATIGVVRTTWNTLTSIFKPVLDAIWLVVSTVFKNVKSFITTAINETINFIKTTWSTLNSIFGGPIRTALATVTTVFGTIKTTIQNVVGGIVSFIRPKLDAVADAFKSIFDRVKNIVKTAMDLVKSGIDTALSGVKGVLNGMIGIVNRAIRGFNKMIDIANKLPGLPDIPKIPEIPRLASGGIVFPQAGGTLAVLAEAGRPERVEPLGSDGLSAGDRAILEALKAAQLNKDATEPVIVQIGQIVAPDPLTAARETVMEIRAESYRLGLAT